MSPSPSDFSEIGRGYCQDDRGRHYNWARFNHFGNSADGCMSICASLGLPIVGFDFYSADWSSRCLCRFDAGFMDSTKAGQGECPATADERESDGRACSTNASGSGPVAQASGTAGYTCYKYNGYSQGSASD